MSSFLDSFAIWSSFNCWPFSCFSCNSKIYRYTEWSEDQPHGMEPGPATRSGAQGQPQGMEPGPATGNGARASHREWSQGSHREWSQGQPHGVEPGPATRSGARASHREWSPGPATLSGARASHTEWSQGQPHGVEPGPATRSGARASHAEWSQGQPHGVEPGPRFLILHLNGTGEGGGGSLPCQVRVLRSASSTLQTCFSIFFNFLAFFLSSASGSD